MDPLGTTALFTAMLASIVAMTRPAMTRPARPALPAQRDDRGRSDDLTRAWLTVAVVGWWSAVTVLAARFMTVDLRSAEVAALTRDEVPTLLRIAGVWAGPAGSALLWFTLVVSLLALVAHRRRDLHLTRLTAAGGAAGAAVVGLAGVFDRVGEPVLAGRGLSPVLEHPLMLVHPPLLYASQAVVLVAALLPGAALGPGERGRARRWVAAGAAMLTLSSMLGAWWAHDELGWGGWWAWDPVENTALAPLVALLASLHVRSAGAAVRWRRVAGIAVLAGIALTRSGLPRSVHAFSSGASIALCFGAAAIVLTIATVVEARRGRGAPGPRRTSPGEVLPRRVSAAVVAAGAGWILTVVGAAGIAAAVLGSADPPAAIDGRTLGRLVAPVGVALAIGLLAFGFRRRHSWPSLVAHAGALLFGLGVVGSLASTATPVTAQLGEAVEVDGSRLSVVEVRVVAERADLVRLEVRMLLDGRSVTAAILDHPDLARTRARPGRLLDPWGETEVVAVVVRDDLVRVEVRRHPGLPFVWAGAAICAVGFASAAQSRRRRFASSSASSDEAGVAAAGSSEAATGSVPPD